MYIIFCVLLSALLTIWVIYLAPLQSIFGTVALNINDWILILLVSFSVIFYIEIQKTLVEVELKERKKSEIYPTRG